MKNCTACDLHKTRTQVVLGEGPKNADIVFIGECPGPDEDKAGRPFVGRAGKLLRNVITSLGVDENRVYITNLVKCFPHTSLNPGQEHITSCYDNLLTELFEIRPKMIVTLGKHSSLKCGRFNPKTFRITKTSGEIFSLAFSHRKEYLVTQVLPVVHPSYVLRGNMKPEEYAMHFLPMLPIYYNV